jgi:hypothetical protein
LLNLLVASVLSALLRWHYVRYASTLANRRDFARNFITVALSVVLIISIVKSSLALSLGLVGALSIVRFRTPIKDPEELSYLFLTIALGIGLGANQIIGTTLAFLLILGVLAARKRVAGNAPSSALYLEVDIPGKEVPGLLVEEVSALVEKAAETMRLRRVEAQQDALLVSYAVCVRERRDLTRLTDGIRERWPQSTITLLDQDQVPGV